MCTIELCADILRLSCHLHTSPATVTCPITVVYTQVTEDVLNDSILNLRQCRQKAGTALPRTMRYSLTIRRVFKVKRLVRLPGQG